MICNQQCFEKKRLNNSFRKGGEWSSKNYRSRKILVGFHGSRSPALFFSGYVPLAVLIDSWSIFKGKEVSVKAPICLLVFINFDVFSSLDIEFHAGGRKK